MNPLTIQLAAVATARAAYDLSVKEAVRSIVDVVKDALQLDDLARPPVEPVAPVPLHKAPGRT